MPRPRASAHGRPLLLAGALALVAACGGRIGTHLDDSGSADGGPHDSAIGDSAPAGEAGCAPGTETCGGTCCTAEQICIAGTCQDLGPECDELWPCPPGFLCEKTLGRCVPGASECEYRPPVGAFSPKIEWQWTSSPEFPSHNQVMMAPMVANLTDDNGDGKIDRDDIPDIVFITFAGNDYWANGVLRAISGDGTAEHFAVNTPATTPGASVAIADLDGDGKPEIVTCTASNHSADTPGHVVAFNADGTVKWTNAEVNCGFSAPAIADLDGDGTAEVVVRYTALDGATGATRWVGKVVGAGHSPSDFSTVADLDEDGAPEVVGGNIVFTHDGQLLWEDAGRPDGYPAVADLDLDGMPEIVTASPSDHGLRAVRHDGSPYWGPVDINQGHAAAGDERGGGPPTIANFDGDPEPEIAAAAGYGYVIFGHDGQPQWFSATQDKSSRVTGSSVFDFEGDGQAEVVYADELQLRIYDGSTGDVLFSQCNTSGTLWEYPVIVDVDNDGHAEIVVGHNNYRFKDCGAGGTGIKIIADDLNNWVRTRRIWNQHSYHVTNIDEDGRVPTHEHRNWDNLALNNFRQNVQPGGVFDAADVTGAEGLVLDKPLCTATIVADVDVTNIGAASVAAGLAVTLYGQLAGESPLALGTELTTKAILPGQTERVHFDLPTPAELRGETIALFAMIDDGGDGTGAINECDEQNNRVDVADAVECKTID